MTDIATLDMNARYRVDGHPGVAFYLRGPVIETVEPEPILDCASPEDPDCEHDEASCWILPEVEEVESDTLVRAVMVGDDREHVVDMSDLTKLNDDEYCGCCGQIGCRWG